MELSPGAAIVVNVKRGRENNMSDALAEQKAAEVEAQKSTEQQQQEGIQKRAWILGVILDPETGQIDIQPNSNVTKPWQVRAMLREAIGQIELSDSIKGSAITLSKMLNPGKKNSGFMNLGRK